MDGITRNVVRDERRRRGWSVRKAAQHGNISNTTWGRYEAGELELSGGITNAVAVAFGWPNDWPTNPPADPKQVSVDEATARVVAALDALQAYVKGTVTEQLDDHAQQLGEVAARVSELSRLVAALEARRPGRHDGDPLAI